MHAVGSIMGETFSRKEKQKSTKGKGNSSFVKGLYVMLLNSELCWVAGKQGSRQGQNTMPLTFPQG